MERRIFSLPSSCSRGRNVAPCGDIGHESFLSGVRQSQLERSFIYIYSFLLSAQNGLSRRDSRTCSPIFQCYVQDQGDKHRDRSSVPKGLRHGDELELWEMRDTSGLLLFSVLMRGTNGNFEGSLKCF